jgi:hypothetical protein
MKEVINMRKEDILDDVYSYIMNFENDDLERLIDDAKNPVQVIRIKGKIASIANHYQFNDADDIYQFILKSNEIIWSLSYKKPSLFFNSYGNITNMSIHPEDNKIKKIFISGILINENTAPEVKEDLIVNYINLLPELFSSIEEIKQSYKGERKIKIVRNLFRSGNERPSPNTEEVFNTIKLKDLSADLILKKFIPEETWTDSFKLLVGLI